MAYKLASDPNFMAKSIKTSSPSGVRPRLRITAGDDIALGPGKAELLQSVHQTGSITFAAKQMNMSYMRAWTLIRTMNQSFRAPLVVALRGGTKGGGGAKLTDLGCEVLALYQLMDSKCRLAVQPEWRKLRKRLRGSTPNG
jgi:molybdate transport system regulatory protein